MTAIYYVTGAVLGAAIYLAAAYLFKKCSEWWNRHDADKETLKRQIIDLEVQLLRAEMKQLSTETEMLALRVKVLHCKMRALQLEMELLTRDLMLMCLYAEMQRRTSHQPAHAALGNPTHVIIDQDGNLL